MERDYSHLMDGILFILNQTGSALQQLQAEVERLTQLVEEQKRTIEALSNTAPVDKRDE
jgi:prefoldin subunit 5